MRENIARDLLKDNTALPVYFYGSHVKICNEHHLLDTYCDYMDNLNH